MWFHRMSRSICIISTRSEKAFCIETYPTSAIRKEEVVSLRPRKKGDKRSYNHKSKQLLFNVSLVQHRRQYALEILHFELLVLKESVARL